MGSVKQIHWRPLHPLLLGVALVVVGLVWITGVLMGSHDIEAQARATPGAAVVLAGIAIAVRKGMTRTVAMDDASLSFRRGSRTVWTVDWRDVDGISAQVLVGGDGRRGRHRTRRTHFILVRAKGREFSVLLESAGVLSLVFPRVAAAARDRGIQVEQDPAVY